MWYESFLSFSYQWERKQMHITISISPYWKFIVPTTLSYNIDKRVYGSSWSIVVNWWVLTRLRSAGFISNLNGNRFCNTRKILWSLLHSIISKCSSRLLWLISSHSAFLKNFNGKWRSGWWFFSLFFFSFLNFVIPSCLLNL